MRDDDTSTAPPAARRRTLGIFLVAIAPQWLVLKPSTVSMAAGASVIVVALALVELHLWSSARRSEPIGGSRPTRPITRAPERTRGLAPRGVTRSVLRLLVAAALIALLVSRVHTGSGLWLLYIVASLLMGVVCWTTLIWMVNAWRNPGAFDETRLPTADLERYQSFSLIVPARHEEAVLEATLSRLLETDHPDFEILVVVGADDLPTAEVADRVATARPDRVRVVVDDSWPKSKPKALNTALPYCKGEITGVFDAEDDVHPALIRRVDQCFQTTASDVVQAGVQLTNLHSSWFSLRNALEYYFWFRSRLHYHARAGFIPLGGNTVFIRTDVLREVDGWDEECLAEDCELGVRLSSMGAKTVVFYEPELVTREETPPTLRAFVRQRTRWNQGYLQTLSRGHWRRLPPKQRALGLYTLAMPYLMALVWIMIPAAIATAIAVTAPVPITLLLFLPALPMLIVLAVEGAGLGDLCRSCGEHATLRDYVRLVLGLPVYQAALSFASARAVVREARGARGWEKTAHFGLHRAQPASETESVDRPVTAPLPSIAPLPVPAYAGLVQGVSTAGAPDTMTARALASESVCFRAHVVGTGYVGHVTPAVIPLALEHAGNADGQSPRNGSGPVTDVAARSADAPLWIRLGSDGVNGADVPARNGGPHGRAVPDRRAAPPRRTLLESLRASRADLAVQLALLATVGLVQVVNVAHWPGSFFDEGTYVSNAWAVERHGALSNYTYGYGHPPLGWLLVSLWTWATHALGNTIYSVAVGRQLMVTISVLSCLLLYVLARRLGMARPFAAGAVALFGLSPVALYFHRLVLIDNPAVAFALAAFVLALSPRRRLWTFAASGACLAASVLSKESMLILVPFVVLAAARNFDARTRRYCITFLASFFLLIALAYPLYATLKGELLPGRGHVSLVGEAMVQLVTRKASGSVFDPRSQTYGIVHDWLHLDPWLLGAAVLLSPLALARRSTRAVALAFLIQATVVLRPGYLPYMYVIGLLPFAALVVAGGAEMLWRVMRKGLHHRDQGRGRLRALTTRASRRLAPVTRATAAVLLAALVAAFVLVVSPRWADADRAAMTTRLDGSELAAQRWLVRHVDHSKRLLVSDDFWVFLVEHGFDSHPVKGGFYSRTVVFYWSFDFDPAVKRLFPQGWRNFDYVVSTQGMRNDLTEVPGTARAVEHSHVVVSFGQGVQRIDIRAVDGHVPPPRVPALASGKRT